MSESTSVRNGSSRSTRADRVEETTRDFVEFWGEMASNWGINRTMAQVYAVLYLSEDALNTDDIMDRLDISRGNANMNLRSLVDWSIVEKTHRPGSRKDFYRATSDVWAATAQIIRERERREIQPVREKLKSCKQKLVPTGESVSNLPDRERDLVHRLKNLIELMEVVEGFTEALLPLVREQNVETIKRLITLASVVADEPR